jgi:purine-binding chemotaxis protein CheW
MHGLVVWTLDMQRYALPFSVVERVVRAVEITPLPDAPAVVSGIVNVQGRVIPVVNVRQRLHLPAREMALTDLLVLAHSAKREVAFFADAVSGLADYPEDDIVLSDVIVPGMGCIAGVMKLADGMILIQDLDRLLSLDEENSLDKALLQGDAR